MANDSALERLELTLTSPRPRAPTTVTSYLSTAGRFLTWLNGNLSPDEMDVRRYFAELRSSGQKESSLAQTFVILKTLYQANNWDWPFTERDKPEAPMEYLTRAFTYEEVAQLIMNRDRYTHNECFYLAMASTYALRRIELARISSKDLKNGTIFIDTAKKGEKRTHLIPEEILPYVNAYHPREHNVSPMSATFRRMMVKGLGKARAGYGWHCFRHTLDTVLPSACAKADIPLTFVGYFLRWSRKTWGMRILGAQMAGVYARPEILSDDPFYIDRQIFSVHPFLSLWQQ